VHLRRSELFGPLVTTRSRKRTVVVLTIALILFVGCMIARINNTDESNGLLGLLVIPIALVAIELGLLPGIGAVAVAMGGVGVWVLNTGVNLDYREWLARAAVYLAVAIGIGWIAGRLRLAEQAIEDREQRLATIVESSTDALVTMDEDGRILAWNPVAQQMFGWEAHEALGKDLAELTMPARVRALMREGKRRFLEKGDRSMIGVRFESRALTRDGHQFPIEVSISAVEEGDHWIFHVFGHDITERKASQEERNRLASIVDSTGDAILSFTLDGRVTSWNPGAERIYGYSQSEALEMSLFDFVPPDRPDDVAPLLDRLQHGDRTLNVDYDRIGKGGRHVEVAVTATPIENHAGKIVAGAAIHRDVSERKRRERYLTAQHSATRLLAQVPGLDEVGPTILPLVAGAGSWLCAAYWTGDGEELHCHDVWSAPESRLPVNPIHEGAVWASSDAPAELQWLIDSEATGSLPSGEQAALGGLRTQLWVPIEVSGELFGGFQFFDRRARDRDEELIGTLAAITAQIGNYVRRRRAEEAAERSKDEFFGLVSHELRTPLTSIIGYGELLFESEADRLTDQGQRYLDVIRRNAQREMRLVGDLLLLVRIQEGTFRIEPEEVDLRRIVEQAVEAARPAAAKREIELSAEAHSTPPFEGDPHRLGQVVDNLLSNAIKFTPKGGEVSVRLGSSNGIAAIEVADTGTGIPEDQQDLLFDRLYRAPSAAASAVPGVGLGLTIVKAIVDAHHGRVAVESEPGVGATFRVELPVDGLQPEAKEAPE
jgi:PAS domain S-box-containing protein